eukprot:6176917-Pleurochrysis_carterae.AAC.1
MAQGSVSFSCPELALICATNAKASSQLHAGSKREEKTRTGEKKWTSVTRGDRNERKKVEARGGERWCGRRRNE